MITVQRHGLEYLRVATWLGLLGGIGVVGTVVIRRDLLGSYMLVDPNFPWMAPLAGAFWFALLGLVLAAASRVLPSQRMSGLTVFVATSAAALSILLEVPG